MSNDINVTDGIILETLNHKIDYDGGNYKGSGLANYVVDKSGDTMAGALHIQTIQSTPLTLRTTKTGTETYNEIQFQDHTGNRRNTIRSAYTYDENGAIQKSSFSIGSNKLDGSAPTGLTLTCDSDGLYFEFPRCTTKPTTTSSASKGRVAVIVQNYVNGTSWYRVWSDGWCEQGGITSAKSVTFLKPFANTNYSVTSTFSQGDVALSRTGNFFPVSKTATTMTRTYDSTVNWTACGYIV